MKKQIKEKLSLYEKLCSIAGKLPFLRPWGSLERKYREAIEFSHLKISPKAAFSLSFLSFLFILLFPSIILFLIGKLTLPAIIFILASAFLVLYFLLDYPLHYATTFRVKASAEMILCIVYMSISMRITHSLEKAVEFAAKNLKGPLGYDLKQLMWDVYAGKYYSVEVALDEFTSKWKRENEEFTKAISLIKTSSLEPATRAEKTLDEAVRLMLDETKERMKRYARELVTPITVINSMGIVLPIIGLVFFPIIGLFLPDIIQPIFLAVGYNLFLPVTVYWMMKDSLEKRPYTFHQPDISKHPKFRKEKVLNKVLIASILISGSLVLLALYPIVLAKETFSFTLLLYSLIVTVGIASGIIIYSYFSVRKKLNLRNEIVQIESEFSEALIQVGNQLARGIPLETALKKILPKIKELKISDFFKIILHNIEIFGMTFHRAVFDEIRGAIKQYPSALVETLMSAIIEIAKKGEIITGKIMLTISRYLKDIREVEDYLRGILGETVSNMQIQAYLLAPLTAGVVVALTAGVMQLMISFTSAVGKIQETLTGGGLPEQIGLTIFSSLLNINKMLPIHYFQLTIGIYLIEIVAMLVTFMSKISNGEENLLLRRNMAIALIVATVIYVALSIGVYLIFNAMIPRFVELIK